MCQLQQLTFIPGGTQVSEGLLWIHHEKVCRNECTKNPNKKHMYIILTQYYSFLYAYLHIFQPMHKLDLHTVNFIKQFLKN